MKEHYSEYEEQNQSSQTCLFFIISMLPQFTEIGKTGYFGPWHGKVLHYLPRWAHMRETQSPQHALITISQACGLHIGYQVCSEFSTEAVGPGWICFALLNLNQNTVLVVSINVYLLISVMILDIAYRRYDWSWMLCSLPESLRLMFGNIRKILFIVCLNVFYSTVCSRVTQCTCAMVALQC